MKSVAPVAAVPPPALPKPVAEPIKVEARPVESDRVVPINLPEVSQRATLAKVFSTPAAPAASDRPANGPQSLPLNAIVDAASNIDFEENPPREADFIPLEYYCQRASSGITKRLNWSWRASECAAPPFSMEIAGRLEDLLKTKDAPLVFFPKGGKKKTPRKYDRSIIEMAAAAAVLAAVLGMGLRIVRHIDIEAPRRELAVSGATGATGAAVAATASAKPSGPLARLHMAIANRAAVELNEGFQDGMGAWGQGKAWAPGWKHNKDGYVQPGRLAFFQPSMKFTDYRMEFFGQIESKGMGWVVRAQDDKNYYAMKFQVIQSGLRPIIGLVHYPVVNGVPGKRKETPLNVMVHNNTSYHVNVAVNGTHIVTSIEGQEVDHWIQDDAKTGGVGLFSEAGERSRVYWVKVAKNEDFLGRVCAYLSGGSDEPRAIAMFIPRTDQYGIQFLTTSPYRRF